MPYEWSDEQWEQLIKEGLANLLRVGEQQGRKSYSTFNAELANATGQPPFSFRNPGNLAGMSRLLANIGERGLLSHPTFLITALVTGKHNGNLA